MDAGSGFTTAEDVYGRLPISNIVDIVRLLLAEPV
jgi:hypothetical protein